MYQFLYIFDILYILSHIYSTLLFLSLLTLLPSYCKNWTRQTLNKDSSKHIFHVKQCASRANARLSLWVNIISPMCDISRVSRTKKKKNIFWRCLWSSTQFSLNFSFMKYLKTKYAKLRSVLITHLSPCHFGFDWIQKLIRSAIALNNAI